MKLRSRVVYKYKCKRSDALYVGETCQHLHVVIADGEGVSAYTENTISN